MNERTCTHCGKVNPSDHTTSKCKYCKELLWERYNDGSNLEFKTGIYIPNPIEQPPTLPTEDEVAYHIRFAHGIQVKDPTRMRGIPLDSDLYRASCDPISEDAPIHIRKKTPNSMVDLDSFKELCELHSKISPALVRPNTRLQRLSIQFKAWVKQNFTSDSKYNKNERIKK